MCSAEPIGKSISISLQHVQATEDKNSAIAQAEKTATKAKLADRLINGLAGEFKRWSDAIHQFAIAESEQLPSSLCFAQASKHHDALHQWSKLQMTSSVLQLAD